MSGRRRQASALDGFATPPFHTILMAMVRKPDRGAPSPATISRWENEGGSSRERRKHSGDQVEDRPATPGEGNDGAADALGRKGGLKRKMRFAANRALSVIFLLVLIPTARAKGVAAVIEHPGAWLMGTKVAIQFFDCGSLVCGRVIWLKESLDPQGLLKHDKLNPVPALRSRQLCGPTIIWNLHPTDLNHWEDGWFYNPDDGSTYSVKLDFQSADVISARIYFGVPTLGKTKTLVRVPIGISAGWC